MADGPFKSFSSATCTRWTSCTVSFKTFKYSTARRLPGDQSIARRGLSNGSSTEMVVSESCLYTSTGVQARRSSSVTSEPEYRCSRTPLCERPMTIRSASSFWVALITSGTRLPTTIYTPTSIPCSKSVSDQSIKRILAASRSRISSSFW